MKEGWIGNLPLNVREQIVPSVGWNTPSKTWRTRTSEELSPNTEWRETEPPRNRKRTSPWGTSLVARPFENTKISKNIRRTSQKRFHNHIQRSATRTYGTTFRLRNVQRTLVQEHCVWHSVYGTTRELSVEMSGNLLEEINLTIAEVLLTLENHSRTFPRLKTELKVSLNRSHLIIWSNHTLSICINITTKLALDKRYKTQQER